MEILRTERLILREMDEEDFPALCKSLQDEKVMYAYEHSFSEQEARAWLEKQLKRYAEDGFGLWAVVLKNSGEMIGQCGLAYQDYCGEKVVEIGYIFNKDAWGNGYATESAKACKRYAFERLGLDTVYSIIRENNIPSQKVAKRNGMGIVGSFTKHYYGVEMPHFVFAVRNLQK